MRRTPAAGAARMSSTYTPRMTAPPSTAPATGTGSVPASHPRQASFRCSRGFTLIELMVVTSLIVILSTLGLVQYRYSVQRSREAVLKEDLFRMRDAID